MRNITFQGGAIPKMPRIALLDTRDRTIGFFDNLSPNAMHYYDDTLHLYLQGSQYTLDFKTSARHKDSVLIDVGCKLALHHGSKDYYLTIIEVEHDETEVSVSAFGFTLELINEKARPAELTSGTFEEYYNALTAELGQLKLGVNEVSDKTITKSFTNDESIMSRLFAYADAFDAELELETALDDCYGLSGITLNIYKKHSDRWQGMGNDHSDEILHYGKNVRGITRKADISEMYTCIQPTGKSTKNTQSKKVTRTVTSKDGVVYKEVTRTVEQTDGKTVTITSTTQGAYSEVKTVTEITEGDYKKTTEDSWDNGQPKGKIPDNCTTEEYVDVDTKDDTEHAIDLVGYPASEIVNGVEYVSDGYGYIRCPEMRDQFPSTLHGYGDDSYVFAARKYSDIDNAPDLYKAALKDLVAHAKPKLTYDVDAYVDAGIGDTYTIEDSAFIPTLYVKCRIVEQEICFTDPSRSKTTFDNFTEMQSQISNALLEEWEKLNEKYKMFTCSMRATNGLVLKNEADGTTLIPYVTDDEKDVTDTLSYEWYRNGERMRQSGSELTVRGHDLEGASAVYGYTCFNIADGQERGSYEVTVALVRDGETDYIHIRYSNDAGKTFTANNGKDPGDWMGTYHSTDPEDSEDSTDYTWVKIKGDPSDVHQTLEALYTEFYLSDSDTELVGGEWSDTQPVFVITKFLWTRIRAEYINPAHVAYSTPKLDPSWMAAIDAVNKSDEALDAATEAGEKADQAVSEAKKIVDEELGPIKDDIQGAYDAAQEAKDQIGTATNQILTEISGTYSTKSDLTQLEGNLNSKIEADATRIAQTVSEEIVQKNNAEIDEQLSILSSGLAGKENDLSELLKESSLAKAELDEARQSLEDLINMGASQSEIDAANEALQQAEDAYQESIAKVESAKKALNEIRNDLESLKSSTKELSTQISQTAQDITMLINNTEKNEDDITEMQSYFKFSEDGLDIGKKIDGQDSMTLRLQNDSMSFFANGQAVAYFRDKNFMIENGEIVKSLKLGRYAFIPRENGSLDFKLVERGD